MKQLPFCMFGLFIASFCTTPTALDLNTATEADLDSLKGIGPATTQRILDARAHAPFQDWADVRLRVKGMGRKVAQHLAEQGVTVNAPLSTKPSPPPPPKDASP